MTKPGAAPANTVKTGKNSEPPKSGKKSPRRPDAAQADTGKSGKTPEPQNSGEPTNGLLGSAAGLLESYAKVMSRLAAGGAVQARGVTASQPASVEGVTPALVEAWTIASASSMRYAQGLTEVFSRHQGALLNATTLRFSADGPSTEQQRAEAEELRQFLREVGEMAMLEARRLEYALEQLGEAVAQAAAPKSTGNASKRSHAVIP